MVSAQADDDSKPAVQGLAMATRGLPALRRQFPHVEADAVALFIDSGGVPDQETVTALAEMDKEAASSQGGAPTRGCSVRHKPAGEAPGDLAVPGQLEIVMDGGESPPHVGTVLSISGLADLLKVQEGCTSVAISVPTGEVLALEMTPGPTLNFSLQDFGMHELRLYTGSGKVDCCNFMVSSPLGEFGEALDLFNDSYDWAWDGGWSQDLEDAAVTLLVALDDHFEVLAASSGTGFMGESVLSTVASPKARIEKHLAKAIELQDALSLGRAVAGVRSFILAQSLFDMFSGKAAGVALRDGAFYQAVVSFEKARLEATSSSKRAEVHAALHRLVLAADAHVADLHNSRRGQDFAERWSSGLRSELWSMLQEKAVIHPLPFQQLRGGGGGYIADMMASMADSFGSASGSVGRAETTEAMSSLSPQISFETALAKVNRWVESLVDEQVNVGSLMSPFEMHAREPWVHSVVAALMSVLSLGLGYVSQGDKDGSESSKMVALLDRVRASLPLNSFEEFLQDRRRRDRLKDVCRVVRAAKKKGQRLVLSVNTDFSLALRSLREHHGDSWVGPCLESVWAKMQADKGVFAFELWLHEAEKQPRLVAADFGHAHTFGRAYYVATRYFDRELRTLQPGFILAYAEAECLRQAGFELWDLGGADHSPMMQYKPQVALEMHRSEYLRRLREVALAGYVAQEDGTHPVGERRQLPLTDPSAAPPAGGERVPTGVIFEDVTEDNLWGAAALRAQEEQAKASLQAAAKAAKKKKLAKNAQAEDAKTFKKPSHSANAKDTKAVESGRQNQDDAFPPRMKPETEPASSAPATAAESSTPYEKEDAKQRFLCVFQKLIAEGRSQNEAAAEALRTIS
eukprot:TRINITY_DN30232_c0_g1_i1.p1 TRINITY_DN30232_c0_g1~~TRINITY_DN30232_c0_g1_i1.p1  ORF type:complete len:882 (+),score=223.00 TRINITY_DN30232_c0_g1_i1:72-2648(+)